MRGLRAALAFLTRLPVGRLDAADFAQAPSWFAAAGLVVGGSCAAFALLAQALWPPVIAAGLAVMLGLLITGALHEDGLADTADGLGSGRPAERALEIMRDSRIGSFGALALFLGVGGRIAALAAIAGAGMLSMPVALVAGHAVSRALMAAMFRRGRYLRASGAGTGMEAPLGLAGVAALVGAAVLGLAAPALALGPGAALAGLAGAVLGLAAIWSWAQRRLGGITGDILGAAQQAAELGFYLGVLACL